jgi:hypothetical protein
MCRQDCVLVKWKVENSDIMMSSNSTWPCPISNKLDFGMNYIYQFNIGNFYIVILVVHGTQVRKHIQCTIIPGTLEIITEYRYEKLELYKDFVL